MTECERIIKEGILPESFFKPETICDFYVDEKRKKIWGIEIDLYLEFERICKLHNLKFWTIGGTLLGGVRHKGFIPWDDDLDVVMLREDYEILLSLSDEFKQPYFLQTPKTDRGYYISFAKLRNSNTTAISTPFKNATFNQGVFLDIFPLDYIDIDKAEDINKNIYESIMKCSSYMKIGSEKYLDERQLKNFNRYKTNDPILEYENIQKLAQSFGKTDYLGLNTCTVYNFRKLSWPSYCFDGTIYIDFHNIKIAIPSGWDEILKICFGNYMEFPPIEKRGVWHSSIFWNPDLTYKNYLLENGGGVD